MKHQIPLKYK